MPSRRDIFKQSAALGLAMMAFGPAAQAREISGLMQSRAPLPIPEGRKIRVAFMVGKWANLIDVAGAWETFASVTYNDDSPFDLMTVALTDEVMGMTGGFLMKPHHTIETAPDPDLIVIPAHGGTKETLDWIKQRSEKTALTMSVCTGAFALAQTGLLEGKQTATHHDYWDMFAERFPDLDLKRGPRFVDNGVVASAGGLTSGIDLALHVVERYFGRDVAQTTATYLEYESQGWKA